MNSIPSDSGVVVRQAQELWSRIDGSAPNPGDYCLPLRHARIAGPPGWLTVPCARRARNGVRNLCHVPAVLVAACRGTIMMQESATIRRHTMSITSVRSRPAFPPLDAFSWPGDFARIPDEEWTRQPVDQSASTTMTSAACRQAPVTCSPSRRCSTRPEGFHGEARPQPKTGIRPIRPASPRSSGVDAAPALGHTAWMLPAPGHTAWMPRSCRSMCMVAASTSYEAHAGRYQQPRQCDTDPAAPRARAAH
jgi:hypothetical protein